MGLAASLPKSRSKPERDEHNALATAMPTVYVCVCVAAVTVRPIYPPCFLCLLSIEEEEEEERERKRTWRHSNRSIPPSVPPSPLPFYSSSSPSSPSYSFTRWADFFLSFSCSPVLSSLIILLKNPASYFPLCCHHHHHQRKLPQQ